ncbi:MAG: pre-peptidase C-terminal domain-containing protein [Candidatus Riflebacteria bacterium]|nr:pre-peptidase C-terminal domain-containing protein [Candidatus Riflebacteria bacterium]
MSRMALDRRYLVALAVCVTAAWAQPASRAPHLGYLYPSGGRQGSTIQVSAGGQFLEDTRRAYVSGDGVRAAVVRYVPTPRLGDERLIAALKRRLEKNLAATPATQGDDGGSSAVFGSAGPDMHGPSPGAGEMPPGAVPIGGVRGVLRRPLVFAYDLIFPPDPEILAQLEHPLLKSLERMNRAELVYVVGELRKPNRLLSNAQLAEAVILDVTIDASAVPGDRELRLLTPRGLTNPIVLQVDRKPEVLEREPNNPDWSDTPKVELPAVLNGQILAGDVDAFGFRAARGQRVVAKVQARRLDPFLADAVPGCFQAVLSLHDSAGDELACADDSGFDPDPVLQYVVPKDGEYKLEIRDALHRGRLDFVYRISVALEPPDAPATRSAVTTPVAADDVEAASTVNLLPRIQEVEPDDQPGNAQAITLPVVVSGTIGQPGDVDLFRFHGRSGDQVVAEVIARRKGSSLDSLLRLLDASGRVLAWNDDHKELDAGLLTHHADSHVSATLPADGEYFVRLTDAQHHGGAGLRYDLRVSSPRPDFSVFVSPSSVNVPPTPSVVLGVRALRRDGFEGEIELALEAAPAGFSLDGGLVPRGRDSVRVTVTVPPGPIDPPVALGLEARARIGDRWVTRRVVPAEEVTQAFMLKHLLPCTDLLVASPASRRGAATVRRVEPGLLKIPRGGMARVVFDVPRVPVLREIRFELSDPPKGVTLQSAAVGPEGLSLVLKADDREPAVGYQDNLIVQVLWERKTDLEADEEPSGPGTVKPRVPVGSLPAIPFQIVAQ